MEAMGAELPIAAAAMPRSRLRARLGVVLLLLGLVVAFVPGLVAGERFMSARWDLDEGRLSSLNWRQTYVVDVGGPIVQRRPRIKSMVIVMPPSSLTELVQRDARWTMATATLLTVPLLFAWWRRSAAGLGRVAGITCSAAGGLSSSALALTHWREFPLDVGPWSPVLWWTLPLGAALMAAAFVVAPAPARPSDC